VEIIFDFELQLDMPRVLRGQGFPDGRPPANARVLELSRQLLIEAQEFIEPVVLYDAVAIERIEDERVVLAGGTMLHSPTLATQLASAREIVVALCTIGPKLGGQVAAYLAARDPLRGVLLDGIGTAAVEELAVEACRRIGQQAMSRGLRLSRRFSPGDDDWPLEDQAVIFQLLPAEEIGLCLTDGYQIVPEKSLSLVIGLGEQMPESAASPCAYCHVYDRCRYRDDEAASTLERGAPTGAGPLEEIHAKE
jgi:hypothetical protein